MGTRFSASKLGECAMKASLHALLIVAASAWPFSVSCTMPSLIDFDQSLAIRAIERGFPQRIAILAHDRITKPLAHTAILDHLRALYNRNKASVQAPTHDPRIPKIIHQIWLGNEMPAAYKTYQASWARMHPSWNIILWTDALGRHPEMRSLTNHYEERLISDLGPLINQHHFAAAPNFAEKSDILRYEILARYGGVYVDCDVECFKPFDILHHAFTFYAGIEPMECGQLVGNAIIAACPNHPIISRCIEKVESSRELEWINQRFGRGMATVCATGPLLLTEAVYRMSHNVGYCDIVLPTSYFYPCGLLRPALPVRAESFAAHYWSILWMTSSS